MKYAHLAARLFGAPLMIHREKLQAIAQVLAARIDANAAMAAELEASALENKPPATHLEAPPPQGVAVIPVHDSLVHRGMGGMNALSGMRSYLDIGKEFQAAIQDPAVSRVVLDIDSPGGEVAGLFELADTIVAARGRKPITALVNDMAASAAYVLASAADKVVVGPGSVTGSIGVIMVHRDQSKADAAQGLKFTEIHAGARKADGSPHRPLEGEPLAAMQGTVDAMYRVMVETIARNRGITPDAVRATEAGTFVGADAVSRGLADFVGSARSIMAEAVPTDGPTVAMEEQMSDKATPAATPAVDLERVTAEARTKAIGEERQRVAAVQKLGMGMDAVPGLAAIIQACIDDGTQLAEAQAKVLGHIQANLGKVGHRNARAQDEAAAPAVPVTAPPAAPAKVAAEDGDEADEETMQKAWKSDGDLRAEFLGDFDSYKAYTQAKALGRFEAYGAMGKLQG